MKIIKNIPQHSGNHRIKLSFVPAPAVLAFIIPILTLSGCYYDLYPETDNRSSARTTAPAYVEPAGSDTAGDIPWELSLQADPSILIPCELERVVDGDTIIVHDPDGKRLRVRLTGIDAPESVHPDENENTEEGRDASQFIKDLLSDTETVYLEYDVAETDQYDRTLAYVWIEYGETYVMVNEIMLSTDHAEPVYIEPNLRYADVFRVYDDDN